MAKTVPPVVFWYTVPAVRELVVIGNSVNALKTPLLDGVCQFAAEELVAVRTCPVVGAVGLIVMPCNWFELTTPEPLNVSDAPDPTVMVAVVFVPVVTLVNVTDDPPPVTHCTPVTVELRTCPLVPTEPVLSFNVPATFKTFVIDTVPKNVGD
jgi:hypothetical protein